MLAMVARFLVYDITMSILVIGLSNGVTMDMTTSTNDDPSDHQIVT
jgi:hypothetical protein